MPIPKPTESDSGLVRHSVQQFERAGERKHTGGERVSERAGERGMGGGKGERKHR